MQTKQHHGSFFLRFMIWGFGVAVAVLSFWLLGYILRDLDRIEGPNLQRMIEEGVPAALQTEQVELQQQQVDLSQKVDSVQAERKLINLTINDSQQTINQILELQRVTTEKQQPLDDDQQAALTENLQLFLATQRQAQLLNNQLTDLNDEQVALRAKQKVNDEAREAASRPIQERYRQLYEQHQWQLAAYKLGLLVPLLLVCGWLFARYSGGTYSVLVYAVGSAVAVRVILVMHQHFPAIYFKYILIILSLLLCVTVLVRMLRMIARPSRDWLLRQYREAYATFRCPQCDYPIQRGPLKFAYWTTRSLMKHSLLHRESDSPAVDQPYTCPCCATRLFETCGKCGGIRHSLLPACEKCGSVQEPIVETLASTRSS